MAQFDRSLVAVGPFRDETTRRIKDAAASVGVSTLFMSRWDDEAAAVAGVGPLAILLRMDASGAEQTCADVRAQARLASVPVFGVSGRPEDLAFTELFAWGGDDLVNLGSAQPLARRLRPLTTMAPEARGGQDEQALVAATDARWRSVMGRALSGGGYSVRFVDSWKALTEECLAPEVRIVVASDDLAPSTAAADLERARSLGSKAAWVVVAPPKRMAAAHGALGSLPRIAIVDGFAPPENVLFLANELLARPGKDQRSSPRMLYGTTVAFRTAGRDSDEVGFSYNVSAGGLYVRTLAPLEAGQEVWLEMLAPRSERRVRLAGQVAWQRPFGDPKRATVPAGFGVKITDGLAGDLERWQAGYESFAATLLG